MSEVQPPRKLRLGDVLTQQGLISEEQLNRALAEQKKTGRKLGQTIVDLGFVEEDKLLKLLSEQLRIPFIDLKHFRLNNALIRSLPETQARRYRALILTEEPTAFVIGMADPMDIFAIDDLQRVLKKTVKPAVVRESELMGALDMVYRRTDEMRSIAVELEDELQSGVDFDLNTLTPENTSDAPVVRLLQSIFEDAVMVSASDIHIEPDETVLRVRQRVDGVLQEHVMKEKRVASALVLRLKIISGLDISEKRLPQDGRFQIRVRDRSLDVRISTMPTQYGESVVMRLLDQSKGMLSLDYLGMPAETRDRFRFQINRPHGLILVTGPTGSGKTTTLYAALSELNSPEKKIITVEDPVEYRLPRIVQVQVNSKIGLSFANVLRSALRQDPDIVLIGEMRDQETAEIGLRAAMTGHLVLSTLHTNDALSTAMRLIDMGAAPYVAASALRAIIAQRLVRKICENCKTEHEPDAQQRAWLTAIGGKQFIDQAHYFHGRGCHQCNNTGYKGRIGVYELLELDDGTTDALRCNDPTAFARAARASNFKTLAACALDYATQGLTSLDEVFRVAAELEKIGEEG